MICPRCKIEHDAGKKFCRKCGSALIESAAMTAPSPAAGGNGTGMACLACGIDYPPNTRFCKKCGKRLEEISVQNTDREPQEVSRPVPVVMQPQTADGPAFIVDSMKTCVRCGIDYPSDKRFCRNCGGALLGKSAPDFIVNQPAAIPAQKPETPPFIINEPVRGDTVAPTSSTGCPLCGTENDASTRFCRKCGAALNKKQPTATIQAEPPADPDFAVEPVYTPAAASKASDMPEPEFIYSAEEPTNPQADSSAEESVRAETDPTKACANCGEGNPPVARFCHTCGKSFDMNADAPPLETVVLVFVDENAASPTDKEVPPQSTPEPIHVPEPETAPANNPPAPTAMEQLPEPPFIVEADEQPAVVETVQIPEVVVEEVAEEPVAAVGIDQLPETPPATEAEYIPVEPEPQPEVVVADVVQEPVAAVTMEQLPEAPPAAEAEYIPVEPEPQPKVVVAEVAEEPVAAVAAPQIDEAPAVEEAEVPVVAVDAEKEQPPPPIEETTTTISQSAVSPTVTQDTTGTAQPVVNAGQASRFTPKVIAVAVILLILSVGGYVAYTKSTGGSGELNVQTSPTGASLSIDGKDSGVAPKSLTGLAPGEHTISASSAGYVSQNQTVMLSNGEKKEISIQLAPETIPAAQETPAPSAALPKKMPHKTASAGRNEEPPSDYDGRPVRVRPTSPNRESSGSSEDYSHQAAQPRRRSSDSGSVIRDPLGAEK